MLKLLTVLSCCFLLSACATLTPAQRESRCLPGTKCWRSLSPQQQVILQQQWQIQNLQQQLFMERMRPRPIFPVW